jgi:hypothetical protein
MFLRKRARVLMTISRYARFRQERPGHRIDLLTGVRDAPRCALNRSDDPLRAPASFSRAFAESLCNLRRCFNLKHDFTSSFQIETAEPEKHDVSMIFVTFEQNPAKNVSFISQIFIGCRF